MASATRASGRAVAARPAAEAIRRPAGARKQGSSRISYAVWNNKGGVGKSFLTFALATEYARANPDGHVLVVDMCPQANVSEILLGGNGAGPRTVAKLIGERKSIGGYFSRRIEKPHEKTGHESGYEVMVSRHNREMPANLSLIVGDPSLEIQVQTINNIAVQELPPDSWKNVHLWTRDIVDAICASHSGRDIIVLIDCNPSFSAYTEQAILGSDRLIVPCSPDGSSARAISNVFRLVYGIGLPDEYKNVSFSKKAEDASIAIPRMHLVIFNRYTQYRGPANAFKAMWSQIGRAIQANIAGDAGHRFSTNQKNSKLFGYQITDAHSAAIIASSLGVPLTSITPGRKYDIAGRGTTVNPEVLERYLEKIRECIEMLGLGVDARR